MRYLLTVCKLLLHAAHNDDLGPRVLQRRASTTTIATVRAQAEVHDELTHKQFRPEERRYRLSVAQRCQRYILVRLHDTNI